jgi:hypothetical protein
VYLVDTKFIGEARKRDKANRGVRRFFNNVRVGVTGLVSGFDPWVFMQPLLV